MAHVNYSTLSDSEICTRIKQSDHLAYTEVYFRYFDPVFRHAYKKLRNEEAARDIVQDVFVNLWVKRSAYIIGPNPGGYLFTAVRNRIFNFWAHEKMESAYWASFTDDVGIEKFADAPTDHRIRERQLMEYIERQVAEFSPRMRRIFEMSRNEHLSHREIAEELGTTEGNVSKQVTNALRILRAKLGNSAYIVLLLMLWLAGLLVYRVGVPFYSVVQLLVFRLWG